ncbi:MAG: hypothetical protein V3S55_14630 [Nitrospiraceae bacterium]
MTVLRIEKVWGGWNSLTNKFKLQAHSLWHTFAWKPTDVLPRVWNQPFGDYIQGISSSTVFW